MPPSPIQKFYIPPMKSLKQRDMEMKQMENVTFEIFIIIQKKLAIKIVYDQITEPPSYESNNVYICNVGNLET